ncbi:type I-B CRISPR-associated protein Cas8b1/Cst1 [Calidifontibacillus erzurumensis]|uniref:type I-B CRISPR-associated protein Cas8b1/Cst1 n=1 Tax=Calidifontibacillus erzurumensis TaxID=2741433 RepID=UPI0035B52A1F
MKTIKLELSDWLYNAGIVGIANILNSAGIEPRTNNNFLEFDISVLENFHEYYFQYFEKRYINYFSYNFIITKGQNFVEAKDWTEETLDQWNKYIETTKKTIKSNSYKAAYQMIPNKEVDVINLEKELKKINLRKKQSIEDIQEDIQEAKEKIKVLLNYFKHPDVKKYIVAKNAAYSVINNFWNGVSFLHKSSTTKDIFIEYKNYFIDPVLLYYEEDHSKDKYTCLVSNQPIKKLSKPHAFDLAFMNKMGVDMSRKTSHFWNLNSSFCYISPLTNFVYSCVPAGFTVISEQGYFVNCNSNIKYLIAINNNNENWVIKSDESIQLLESRTYFQLIDFMEKQKASHVSKEVDNIQIIKYSNKNDSKVDSLRPYTFNILSKDKLAVIQEYFDSLNKMLNKFVKLNDDSYINIFQSVLERLYKNKNQFDLIAALLRVNLPKRPDEKIKGYSYIKEILYFNNHFLWTIKKYKEDDSMSGYSSYVKKETINEIEQAGRKLALSYMQRNAANKLSGITYRLLNALKTKDTGKFMDTFINAHMYGGKDGGLHVPIQIIDVLQDEDKLQTLGYAFILGLRSGLLPKEEKEEK